MPNFTGGKPVPIGARLRKMTDLIERAADQHRFIADYQLRRGVPLGEAPKLHRAMAELRAIHGRLLAVREVLKGLKRPRGRQTDTS